MKYQPSPTPTTLYRIQEFVQRELRRIADAIGTEVELSKVFKEPPNAPDGTIVYADGTSWDPGSGPGFYGKEEGSWIKL
jgi:hypothetical protein